MRLNLVITSAPFGPEPINAYIDTSSGHFDIGTGHVDSPDVTVSMSYGTAKALFVSGNVQAVLQAFLAGQIKVDGDLSKLLDPGSGMWPSAFANGPFAQPPDKDGPGTNQPAAGHPPLGALALAQRLAEITE
ncbi:MAG: SCP2 sterol-binding domain-containing protein [Acidimicrobiales bacterium]